jgi:hypothetical protein
MRWLIVAASLAFASGVFAQDATHPPKATPAPSTPAVTQSDIQLEHPEYYREPDTYRPCPASVVFPNRQHDCVGCPSVCQWRGIVK